MKLDQEKKSINSWHAALLHIYSDRERGIRRPTEWYSKTHKITDSLGYRTDWEIEEVLKHEPTKEDARKLLYVSNAKRKRPQVEEAIRKLENKFDCKIIVATIDFPE